LQAFANQWRSLSIKQNSASKPELLPISLALRAEEAQQEHCGKLHILQAALDSAIDGIVVDDFGTTVQFFNQSLSGLLVAICLRHCLPCSTHQVLFVFSGRTLTEPEKPCAFSEGSAQI